MTYTVYCPSLYQTMFFTSSIVSVEMVLGFVAIFLFLWYCTAVEQGEAMRCVVAVVFFCSSHVMFRLLHTSFSCQRPICSLHVQVYFQPIKAISTYVCGYSGCVHVCCVCGSVCAHALTFVVCLVVCVCERWGRQLSLELQRNQPSQNICPKGPAWPQHTK